MRTDIDFKAFKRETLDDTDVVCIQDDNHLLITRRDNDTLPTPDTEAIAEDGETICCRQKAFYFLRHDEKSHPSDAFSEYQTTLSSIDAIKHSRELRTNLFDQDGYMMRAIEYGIASRHNNELGLLLHKQCADIGDEKRALLLGTKTHMMAIVAEQYDNGVFHFKVFDPNGPTGHIDIYCKNSDAIKAIRFDKLLHPDIIPYYFQDNDALMLHDYGKPDAIHTLELNLAPSYIRATQPRTAEALRDQLFFALRLNHQHEIMTLLKKLLASKHRDTINWLSSIIDDQALLNAIFENHFFKPLRSQIINTITRSPMAAKDKIQLLQSKNNADETLLQRLLANPDHPNRLFDYLEAVLSSNLDDQSIQVIIEPLRDRRLPLGYTWKPLDLAIIGYLYTPGGLNHKDVHSRLAAQLRSSCRKSHDRRGPSPYTQLQNIYLRCRQPSLFCKKSQLIQLIELHTGLTPETAAKTQTTKPEEKAYSAISASRGWH